MRMICWHDWPGCIIQLGRLRQRALSSGLQASNFYSFHGATLCAPKSGRKRYSQSVRLSAPACTLRRMEEADIPFAVAGDLHGDTGWSRRLVRSAAAAGVKTLFQVGDLGVCFPGRDKYRFDRRLDGYLGAAGMKMIWVVGNHDSHEDLAAMPVEDDGLVHVRENILMLPRGGRIDYAGLTVGGLGGAFSVDYRHRTPGKDWWPGDEEVQPEDVEKLAAGGPVDVLLTHDVPSVVEMVGDMVISAEDEARANASRILLTQALEKVDPSHIFCGHWHVRKIQAVPTPSGETRVDVLNMNGSRWGNAVLVHPGTPPLKIEPLEVKGY